MENVSVTIIGTGALGSALAKVLYAQGIAIHSLYNRSSGFLETTVAETRTKISGTFPKKYEDLGELIVVTTGDQYIEEIANKLAVLHHDFSAKKVVHCSGAQSSDLLSSLQKKGAAVASFHPVQTFTRNSKPEDFKNIYFDLEGDQRAKELLKKIVHKIGSHSIEISRNSKPYLHAAAVMASNYMLALIDAASQIAAMGDMEKEEAQKVLMPLASTTIENALKADHLEDALSGPVARGDRSTITSHLALLKNNPKMLALYKQLGNETLKLTNLKGTISSEQYEDLANLFQVDYD